MNGRDDEDAHRRVMVIKNIRDFYFKKHFRMDRACFERLVNVIGHHRTLTEDIKRLRTPIDEATLIGLWLMYNTDTFRSCGLNCDTSITVAHVHYKKFIKVMCEISHRFIKWPDPRQRERTALFYERNFGFPGVVGSIDGTLIAITAPSEQKQRYVDKNNDYSINVQIVSDHRRLIRDVSIRQPGSVYDARVFRRSPLAKCLYSRDDMLDPDQHIIGDKAYVLTNKVFVPYRDDGHLTPSHRNFNFLLSQCRCTVERLNALLKSRMERLKKQFWNSIDGMVFDGEVPAINLIEAMDDARPAGYDKRLFIRALIDQNEANEGEE